MVPKKALGKGLSALIPERRTAGTPGVTLIPVDGIAPNPHQPRKSFREESLKELAESIRTQGVLQPVLVKMSPSGYELIAGERRWRAAILAGLREIPALIKEAGREESTVMALVENIQRENLNPIEAALAYQSLADDFGQNQEEIARLVGKDRVSVANYLRLLKLPLAIQDDLATGSLSMGHARALLALTERKEQLHVRDLVVNRGLSVRETEALVRKVAQGSGRKSDTHRHKSADPHMASIQEDLKRRLGTKVQIMPKGAGGSIQIQYHSADEFERLLEQLLGGGR
jgi:ParB family chromosome partitioning protein